MPPAERPPTPRSLTDLVEGEISVKGRMPWSSNATFLAEVTHRGACFQAVYKPHGGERDLWDFPDGLYRREVAAFVVSESLGWRIVPDSVLRPDGPLGPGSLQRFVDADFSQHYFTLVENSAHHPRLRQMAVFDLVVNNADRKSGHCLIDDDGHIWGIDNGLCFHHQPKLRTVIWDFGGERFDESLRADCARLASDPPASLGEVLHDVEVAAMVARAAAVSRLDRLPDPDPDRRPYPWPLV